MPIDRLAVATGGFRSFGVPDNRRLCIATDGFRCVAVAPSAFGGGFLHKKPYCDPCEPQPDCEPVPCPDDIAAAIYQAANTYDYAATALAKDIAAHISLVLRDNGDTVEEELAIVAALVFDED